jgi:hypothetical protein
LQSEDPKLVNNQIDFTNFNNNTSNTNTASNSINSEDFLANFFSNQTNTNNIPNSTTSSTNNTTFDTLYSNSTNINTTSTNNTNDPFDFDFSDGNVITTQKKIPATGKSLQLGKTTQQSSSKPNNNNKFEPFDFSSGTKSMNNDPFEFSDTILSQQQKANDPFDFSVSMGSNKSAVMQQNKPNIKSTGLNLDKLNEICNSSSNLPDYNNLGFGNKVNNAMINQGMSNYNSGNDVNNNVDDLDFLRGGYNNNNNSKKNITGNSQPGYMNIGVNNSSTFGIKTDQRLNNKGKKNDLEELLKF